MIPAKERLIVALDVDSKKEAERLLDALKGLVKIFKIGAQPFTAFGPKIVDIAHKKGGKVFLDLKYHDIPDTVARAGREATRLGVFMFNVHSLGGMEMMRKCYEASCETAEKEGIQRPKILAVTLLTSITLEALQNEIGIKSKSMEDEVKRLASMASDAGLDGVVSSPQEITAVREVCSRDFLIVTPGVRPAGAQMDDQKRISVPKEAIKAGADYIVIGRPIIKADDPAKAAEEIIKEMEDI
ncbi:MAG: orotidine-5'-phosphate decarboxylase [Nitrospirae bacterium]|nr:orotidine-5'-phosphate decarboxylase [Nitrospirota bacterium]